MKKLVWLLPFASAIIFSCKKPSPKIPEYTTPINDSIRRVVFDSTSAWMYRRMISGAIDCVYVKSLAHDTAMYTYGDKGYNFEYYKAVYHIEGNGKEYTCYYYMDRAKFNCEEPHLVQTGQEFFFANEIWGQGMEKNAHCCYITDKELSKEFYNVPYGRASKYEIDSTCQWDPKLFTYGTYYWFNKNSGFLQFYLAGNLGWDNDIYTIVGNNGKHIF